MADIGFLFYCGHHISKKNGGRTAPLNTLSFQKVCVNPPQENSRHGLDIRDLDFTKYLFIALPKVPSRANGSNVAKDLSIMLRCLFIVVSCNIGEGQQFLLNFTTIKMD